MSLHDPTPKEVIYLLIIFFLACLAGAALMNQREPDPLFRGLGQQGYNGLEDY